MGDGERSEPTLGDHSEKTLTVSRSTGGARVGGFFLANQKTPAQAGVVRLSK